MTGRSRKFNAHKHSLLLMFLLLLAGCERLQPYRVSSPQSALLCNPDVAYHVAGDCRTAMLEHSDSYDLFFTEFTDQGLPFPTDIYPGMTNQIDYTLKGLQKISRQSAGVSVIVFVHGWKHNAQAEDSNVSSFRRLLQATAALERARGSNYRVVGVYVGWRGLSVIPEPLNELSFWSRKSAALRVAQGSPRELFNRLRSFKCAENNQGPQQATPGGCFEQAGGDKPAPKVRVLMIGHSFGAWILYNAVAGSLMESLTHADDTGAAEGLNTRFADMIVLLNPAFEATRYAPLNRIATDQATRYAQYQAPLMVSVTTSADWATGSAFPAGRFINTLLESEVGDEEHSVTRQTMGHVPGYITHSLVEKTTPGVCDGWKVLTDPPGSPEMERQARINKQAEDVNTDVFPGTRRALEPHWQRSFCGGAQLTHQQYDPNSVIWNVATDATIMDGHNDIENPKLVDFIRQLYHDTIRVTRLRGPGVITRASRTPDPPVGLGGATK